MPLHERMVARLCSGCQGRKFSLVSCISSARSDRWEELISPWRLVKVWSQGRRPLLERAVSPICGGFQGIVVTLSCDIV